MEFRIIKVDIIPEFNYRYHCNIWEDYDCKRKIDYYIVQYKRDSKFFGLIKYDWESVYFNAEEMAWTTKVIKLKPTSSSYSKTDYLVPGINYAKQLLGKIKVKFNKDPAPTNYELIYQDKEKKKTVNSSELANKYSELIEC